jgi:multimeric flavodoxin WrbA
MQPQIIGISRSPIKKSNADRLVQAVLESSGLASEFVKLSRIKVRQRIGCIGCKKDNICKPKDDCQELAEKVRHAGAVVVGGYSPCSAVDGFTKAFSEAAVFPSASKQSEPGKTCCGCYHRHRMRCPRFGGIKQPN